MCILFSCTVGGHAAPLNLYKGHGVFAAYTGLEQTIIVENNIVRMWYHAVDYIDSTYAVGGINYGTVNYPFINGRVEYMDVSISDFTFAVEGSTDIPWVNQGTCISGVGNDYVVKGPDGKYHMLVNTSQAGNFQDINYYRSDTGMPGTWSLIQAGLFNAGTLGFNALGNSTFFYDGTYWNVYIEYYRSTSPWVGGYWKGTSLTSLSRVDSIDSPVFASPNGAASSVGEVQPIKYYDKSIDFGHDAITTGQYVPTDITFYTADSFSGPFVRSDWVLQLSSMGYFMGDMSQPFGSDSQLGDPVVFEISGKTYMVYETVRQELYDVPSLSVAWWDYPLSTVVADLLGIPVASGNGGIAHLGAFNTISNLQNNHKITNMN